MHWKIIIWKKVENDTTAISLNRTKIINVGKIDLKMRKYTVNYGNTKETSKHYETVLVADDTEVCTIQTSGDNTMMPKFISKLL